MNLFDLGRFKNIAMALAAFMLLISMLLAFNVSMSNRFNNDLSGIKHVAQQQMKPAVIVATSRQLDARLKMHEPISDAFTDLGASVAQLDQTITDLANEGKVTDDLNHTYYFPGVRDEP